MTNLLTDLRGQVRAHRARRAAAEAVCRAATDWAAAPYTAPPSRTERDLTSALVEWNEARAASGNYTIDLGRVILTTTGAQPDASPLIDPATLSVYKNDDATDDPPTRETVQGWAIRLPGRRRALVVGVRGMSSRHRRRRRRGPKLVAGGWGPLTGPPLDPNLPRSGPAPASPRSGGPAGHTATWPLIRESRGR